jgi:hypothetical protein
MEVAVNVLFSTVPDLWSVFWNSIFYSKIRLVETGQTPTIAAKPGQFPTRMCLRGPIFGLGPKFGTGRELSPPATRSGSAAL